MDRILITGGSGFVGTSLVRALLRDSVSIRVLDDFSTGLPSNLSGLDVEVIAGSVTDKDAVRASCAGVQSIVHLAARGSVPRSIEEPWPTDQVNSHGTLNILEEARKTGAHVIFSSSSSVYGRNDALPKTESMWVSPMNPYAASKLSAEAYCSAYAAAYGVPVTVFRFFNIFGPWQRPDHDYAAVIPRWVRAALDGTAIPVDGDGTQTRDFTYVDDVVDVLEATITTGLVHPTPINLAFGNRISLNDVHATLERVIGKSLPVEFRPPRDTDVPHSQNDPRLLKELFPSVTPVAFETALAATVEWMRGSTVQRP